MKKKIFVVAPALSRSGYGVHARTVLRALRTREDEFDIYLHNLNWGSSSWIYQDDEERRWVDELLLKTVKHQQNGGTFDASIQVTIPNEWQLIAPINVGVTAGIETTKVSPQWIEKANMMDRIIVVSNHAKYVYENTIYAFQGNNEGSSEHPVTEHKCTTPIDVVGYPVLQHDPEELDLELDYDFNFLVVAQWGPRKNVPNTIKWFVEEFHDQEIGLVLKINIGKDSIIDRFHTNRNIEAVLGEFPDRVCKIYLLHGDLTDGQMTSLYQNPKIKSLINLSHGEGFGLPIFEAAYNGMPVMAPDWSGHVDFLYTPVKDKKTNKVTNKAMFSKVPFTMQQVAKEAVWDGVVQEDSMWCYPEQGKFKMRLKEVVKDYGRFKSQATKLQKWICKTFTEKNQYKLYTDSFMESFPEHDVDEWFAELNHGIEVHEG
jgi:glycosyltransferase involved in cell wall biosynthesis